MTTPTCRLGVIEEEREEDERKLSIAIAAAERMNVLVRELLYALINTKCPTDYPLLSNQPD